MPIAGQKPTSEPEVRVELPAVEPTNYKSVIYDDNNVPLQSLLAFVEGAPWPVDYYAQVKAQHNDLRDVDPGQQAVYQQYQKFVGLEIRVDQALTTSFDSNSANSTVTGSGNMYPFMKVNVGDVFVTDVADNKRAMFRLTEVSRRTFNRDSAWTIEYTMIGYVDGSADNQAQFAALENGTIRTYYFSKDRLLEGLQPFIKSEEYANVTNLRSVYEDLIQYYFQNIFNLKYSTLVVPGQDYAIYDMHLVEFLMKIVDTEDADQIKHVKRLTADNDIYLQQPDLWSMLYERDYPQRLRCNQVFGLVGRNYFNRNTFLTGFRYSNVQYLVYPNDPDTSLNIEGTCGAKPIDLQEIINTTPFKGQDYSDVDNTYVDDLKSYDIIHEVLSDDRYVLSAAFYDDTDDKSLLEILVRDYMNRAAIDLPKLLACCNVFKKWKRLEQFYYGPLLLTLLREAYRAQYT